MAGRGTAARLAAAAMLLALVAACTGAPGGTGRQDTVSRAGSTAGPTGASTGPTGAATMPGGPASGGPLASGRTPRAGSASDRLHRARSWVYQLQGYRGDRLDEIAAGPWDVAVVDLARDAHTDWFTASEIAALHRRGKVVLAYFEIGSIENFRPEYAPIRSGAGDLVLNRWADWPEEFFVRYWDPRWWDRVVRPRVDQAQKAGFDGVYLDTPLAYEEIDLRLVPGWSRDRLARAMGDLVVKLSRYAKARRPGFLVLPQNSPELRHQPGYTAAIDGLGVEELFFQDTDVPCTQSWCPENLADVRALRSAGKVILAVDYARSPAHVRSACAAYAREHFVGYVADVGLDNVRPRCS